MFTYLLSPTIDRMDTKPQIIALANFKGGSAKTTSSAFLAHAFAQLGKSVLLVDADPTRKQGSLLKWSEIAEWSIPTVGLATKNLHRQLPGIAGDRYEIIIIDTPPLDQEAGIVYSAMRAAGSVVVPLAPSMMELAEVPDVLAAADEVTPFRDQPHEVLALLNRTIANAVSTDLFRGKLEQLGCRVLKSEIRRREAIAGAFGRPVTGNLHGYLSAAQEIGYAG